MKMEKCLILVLGVLQYSVVYVNGRDVLCNDQLIQNLPNDHLTSTSNRGDPILTTSPTRGRLNMTDTLLNNGTTLMGGWSPSSDSLGHYIQATFDHMTMVNEILTQGRHQGNGHVTMYKVEYTEDGSTWQTVNNDVGVEKIFQGNMDSDTIQANALDCPIFAKGIRIIPLDWETHVALRFDVTGCYVDNSLTGTTTPTVVTSSNSTPSSSTASPYTATTSPTVLTTVITTQAPTTTVSTVKTTTQPTTVKTTTQPTTVKTTTRPTTVKTTTRPTTIKTTTSTTQKTTPTTVKTTSTTVKTTTVKTTSYMPKTTPWGFLPGVLNPFGTTAKPVATTIAPFHPGIPDPFGPGQLIG